MELVFVVVSNDLDFYIDLFLKVKRSTREPATLTWYTRVLGYYRAAVAGIEPAWPPTVSHCLAFFETFEAKKLSDHSRNNYFRALRSFLNWLKRTGYIEQNPLDFLDPIPDPRPLPKAPPEQDMREVLARIERDGDTWHDVRDLALFFVALDTGARPGELARMLIGDIDEDNGSIRVHSKKDHEDRELVLGDDAGQALALWQKERGRLGVPDDLRHLWISNYQHRGFRPFTHWGIRQRLRFWQDKAGIDRFTPYAIRHAYAVYSLRNLADLIDIRDQMGHASITTTAKYTKVVNVGRQKRHRQTSPLKRVVG